MTDTEAKEYALRMLGKGFVAVELTEDQMKDAIGDAFRWFNDRKGLRKLAGLVLLSGQNEYDLSALVPPVITVLGVSFPRASDIDLRAIYGDDLALPGVPWSMFPYGALQGGVYSSLVQALQYRKTMSKVISSDLDYEFTRVVNEAAPDGPGKPLLRVFPGFNGPTGACIVSYKAFLTTMPQIADDPRHEDFVLRRLVIAAKKRLGRPRSKYGSLPTARGERTLDGSALIAEADQELKDLEEDLASTNMPIPFFVA